MKMDKGWAVVQLSRGFLVCTRAYVQSAAPQNIIDENGQEKGMLRENGEGIKEAKTSYSAVPPQGNSTLQKVECLSRELFKVISSFTIHCTPMTLSWGVIPVG